MATSKKGSRILRVFKALEAHPIIGISNKELAEGLGLSAVHVSRELDNGNFAYSVKTLQIAERFRQQQERLQSRIAEIGRRVEID